MTVRRESISRSDYGNFTKLCFFFFSFYIHCNASHPLRQEDVQEVRSREKRKRKWFLSEERHQKDLHMEHLETGMHGNSMKRQVFELHVQTEGRYNNGRTLRDVRRRHMYRAAQDRKDRWSICILKANNGFGRHKRFLWPTGCTIIYYTLFKGRICKEFSQDYPIGKQNEQRP